MQLVQLEVNVCPSQFKYQVSAFAPSESFNKSPKVDRMSSKMTEDEQNQLIDRIDRKVTSMERDSYRWKES